MKTKIDKDFFKNWKNKLVVMHCKTKEEAVEFCRLMHDNGLRWCSGNSYSDVIKWGDENTCYEFNEGKWSFIKYFKDEGYKILELSDYIIDEEANTTQEKIEQIATSYGIETQSRQAVEELEELIVAIQKYLRDKNGYTLMAVEEEIADVEIMTAQLKHLIGVTDETMDRIKAYKLDRQLEWIERENKLEE